MKTHLFLSFALAGASLAASAAPPAPAPSASSQPSADAKPDVAGYRIWRDVQNRPLKAKFNALEDPNVILETEDGKIYPVPLARLSAADQAIAKNLASVGLSAAAPDGNRNYKVWHFTDGQTVNASFRGIEGENMFYQTQDGNVYRTPLNQLIASDQEMAKTLKPEGLGIPMDPHVAQAAARIDQIVVERLKYKGLQPNALANDEQFIRRVYLDLAGRIPTKEEVLEFMGDDSSSKKAKVIDKLVRGEGFTSRMFNYFSDMLRMEDTAQKGKFYSYEEWFKDQLTHNRHWDQIVHDMMTADGKLIENGATGYLLRDKGMRLDNLSLTLSTFLGANVACAQCHDHPFASWTQMDFYQMAAFFGHTETYSKKKGKKGGGDNMMLAGLRKELTQDELKKLRRLTQVNNLDVYDTATNDVKLPEDYRYKNGKAGEIVAPRLITWSAAELKSKIYLTAMTELQKKGGEENARKIFADWMTSKDNPRFAMTIANRIWKLIFGIGVKEPVTDLDDPEASNNPVLLSYLASEMKRLNFDLRAFTRILCNTQTYQREAINREVNPGEPYYFPGPVLRRMTAAQAWDSCVTLAIGEKVDNFKLRRADQYAAMVDIKPGMPIEVIRAKLEGRRMNPDAIVGGGAGKNGKGPKMTRKLTDNVDDEDVDHKRPEVLQGLVLARASELPQPEKDQHFLRMFGQSDRQVADTDADEGSIPQVLMLMNGEAQKVLRNPKSRVYATAAGESRPENQIDSLYLSFFSRHPHADELAAAKSALSNGLTISDLTWVLFNSREFVFVQ